MIKFEIVVPLLNRAHLIVETLQSLLAQTYPHWNAHVVDDGSTDSSVVVAREYAAKSEGRIHVVERPDSHRPGGNGARNYGASLGAAPYLIFLDSDDLFTRDALALRAELVAKHPEADMVVFPSGTFLDKIGDSEWVWNTLNLPVPDLTRFLSFDIPWCVSGPVWKRSAFNRLNGFDETAQCWQDWELHVRAIITGLNIVKARDTSENYHHYSRLDRSGTSISQQGANIEKVKNRAALFERMRPLVNRHSKSDWFFFRMYYIESHTLEGGGNAEAMAIFENLRKLFPVHWQLWWRLNKSWPILMQWEVNWLGKWPVPKLANRLYNWKALHFVWLGRKSGTFLRNPVGADISMKGR